MTPSVLTEATGSTYPPLTLRSPGRAGGGTHPVAAWWTVRRTVVPAIGWGAGLGGYTAVQALGYTSTYKTVAERLNLTKSLTGQAALVGPGHDLQTAAGYTAWKCLMAVALVSSVWGLLTSTRLVRGEEDAGRWELLLAGRTTRRAAVLQVLAGLAVSALVMWATMSCVVALVGGSSSVKIGVSAAVFYSATVMSAAVMFLAVGVLASQLAATRRAAAAYAGAALGSAFLVRMSADTVSGLAWLRWASPLGWLEQARPLTGSHPAPLGLALLVAGGCGYTAVRLAGGRDLGSAVLGNRSGGRAHLGSVDSVLGLVRREVQGVAIAWLAGTAVLAGVIGSETSLAARALSDSESAAKVLVRLGGTKGVGRAYLGVSFELVALLLILTVANQVTALRDEEASGRLDNLLSQPVSRPRWLGARVGAALGWIVAIASSAGLVIWATTGDQHLGISWVRYVEGAVNLAPAALVVLGLGVLVFGTKPRLTRPAVYGYTAWALLAQLLAAAVPSARWAADTSVLHQMGAVPARSLDWWSAAAMTAVAVSAATVGALAFFRRDLAAE